jgi:hypothetical protein
MSLSDRLREVRPSGLGGLSFPAGSSERQATGGVPTLREKLADTESYRELSTTCRTPAHSTEKRVLLQEGNAALSNSEDIIP